MKGTALGVAERLLRTAYGVVPCEFVREEEAEEYCGWKFTANSLPCRFRQGKVTPTKNGQFVTLYDRSPITTKIVPTGIVGPVPALLMVQCVEKDFAGHFMFPSAALLANKIGAVGGSGRKLAFRVYPPWVDVESKQAASAQKWQCQYFVFDADAAQHASTVRTFLGMPPAAAVPGTKRPRSE